MTAVCMCVRVCDCVSGRGQQAEQTQRHTQKTKNKTKQNHTTKWNHNGGHSRKINRHANCTGIILITRPLFHVIFGLFYLFSKRVPLLLLQNTTDDWREGWRGRRRRDGEEASGLPRPFGAPARAGRGNTKQTMRSAVGQTLPWCATSAPALSPPSLSICLGGGQNERVEEEEDARGVRRHGFFSQKPRQVPDSASARLRGALILAVRLICFGSFCAFDG